MIMLTDAKTQVKTDIQLKDVAEIVAEGLAK
jgi:hypothetical protein